MTLRKGSVGFALLRSRTVNIFVSVLMILVFGGLNSVAQDSEALDAANEALCIGDYSEARKLYKPLVDSETGDLEEEITGYFETFLATGEYKDGLAEVNEYLEKKPDNPYLLHIKGKFYEAAGEYALAEEAYIHSWTMKNDFYQNLFSIGELFKKTGRKRDARSCYTMIVQDYRQNRPRTAKSLSLAAVSYARLDDFHEANSVFNLAYNLDPRNTQNLFWWADLFREKFNKADAQRTFEEAIAINPKSEKLYIGYARSFESLTGWEKMATQALEANPNSVDANNILAEIAILDSDYDRAEEVLNLALEINPVYERSLANLASVYHLRNDVESFERIRTLAEETNYECGDFYVAVAQNCIYRFRYADAVKFCRQAISHEFDNWYAHALLGSNILRLGRVDEAHEYLSFAYEGDPFNIFARNSLELIDDYQDFTIEESEHFTLLIHNSESSVLAKPMLSLAEECYDSFSVRYPYVPEEKIRIEAYNNHDDFAVRISGLPGIGLLGVCFGDVVAIDTPRAQADNNYNWAMTLWHELAHVMALGISDNRVPRWFTEGLSVFEEKQARPEWGREMELELFSALDNDLLLSIGEINSGFTRPSYSEQVLLSYYESAQIIDFIVSQYGFEVIIELLNEFRKGDWEAAFPVVLNTTIESLNDAFFTDLQAKRERYDRVMTDIPPLLSVLREDDTQETDSSEKSKNPFFRALNDGHELLGKEEYVEAERKFIESIDIFPNYTGSANPYIGLAKIYRQQEDKRKLADILEKYLLIYQYGADEARELGELQADDGDYDSAVYYYNRSMEVAPYDINAHTRLAELYNTQKQYTEETEERRIVLALKPIDRARAYYFLALSLYNDNQISKAKTEVMRSLELAPGYREAQKLLLDCVGE
ncbi:tetratricopeptide repeat protein [Candidatus Latescibacterota bacterium]